MIHPIFTFFLTWLFSIAIFLSLPCLPGNSLNAKAFEITKPQPKPISADFPYQSHYLEVLGSQMHYIDEGEGDPILFIHGNPTSSYLWRNIIPFVLPQGRAIALDLIGMGKSDKPDLDYTFADQSRYLEAFIDKLDLQNITLVVHDWGSTLGLHYARRHEDNVRGITLMEGMLPPANPFPNFAAMGKIGEVFQALRDPELGYEMVIENNFMVEELLPHATMRKLTEEEIATYQQPYLNPEARKPTLVWTNQIPVAGEPADVEAVVKTYSKWLTQTPIPKLYFYVYPGGAANPPGTDQWLAEHLPNLETHYLGVGLHYLQEDYPEEIGRAIADWMRRNL